MRRLGLTAIFGLLAYAPVALACLSLPPRVDGAFFSSGKLIKEGDTEQFNRWTAVLVDIQADRDNCNIVKTVDIFDEKGRKRGTIVDDNRRYMEEQGETKQKMCRDPSQTRALEGVAPNLEGSGEGALQPAMGCNQGYRVFPVLGN